jgi:hypothetical protein
MAHSEAGSRLESNIVPVAGVNDLPQLPQRYACTPLRSWPSRLESAEPHHGHASGTYELKNSASPPLQAEDGARDAPSRAPSLHVMC